MKLTRVCIELWDNLRHQVCGETNNNITNKVVNLVRIHVWIQQPIQVRVGLNDQIGEDVI